MFIIALLQTKRTFRRSSPRLTHRISNEKREWEDLSKTKNIKIFRSKSPLMDHHNLSNVLRRKRYDCRDSACSSNLLQFIHWALISIVFSFYIPSFRSIIMWGSSCILFMVGRNSDWPSVSSNPICMSLPLRISLITLLDEGIPPPMLPTVIWLAIRRSVASFIAKPLPYNRRTSSSSGVPVNEALWTAVDNTHMHVRPLIYRCYSSNSRKRKRRNGGVSERGVSIRSRTRRRRWKIVSAAKARPKLPQAS